MSETARSTVMLTMALAAGLMPSGHAAAEEPALVPRPEEIKAGNGEFLLSPDTRVVATGRAAREAVLLVDALAPAMGCRLRLVEAGEAKPGAIALALDASRKGELGEEGYALRVTAEGIALRAAGPAGLFYGIQTLRQLLPADVYRNGQVAGTKWAVPCMEITDRPRFAWRGLLIDPARHFIPKRDVMRFIDAMAMHKLNRLQIHFTDGQGWRVEIRKYPLLTEIGSRWHNRMSQWGDKGKIYGGYYTQADIRELVAYAERRHVTIVPEIEMPFHAGAAIVAYPKLGFDPEKLGALPPMQRVGKTGNLVVPRPYTVRFFQDVLDEVIELFPSKHIHVGGDEAHAGSWAKVPEMQELMKREGLQDVHELHSWFIKQIDAHITRRGRRMVGWDEILQGGLAKGATVMSWRGTKGGITAAKAGHDVVMAPTSHTYFDYRQTADKNVDPPALGNGVTALETVYAFEPVPAALSAAEAAHVLGGQAQLWGELIPNERHREFMTYPRACALAEAVWSPKQPRDYARFLDRLKYHLRRLDAAGIHYRRLTAP